MSIPSGPYLAADVSDGAAPVRLPNQRGLELRWGQLEYGVQFEPDAYARLLECLPSGALRPPPEV